MTIIVPLRQLPVMIGQLFIPLCPCRGLN